MSGCRHLRVTYTAGEMFPEGDDCNTCKCFRTGDIKCTDKKCHPGKLIAVNTILQCTKTYFTHPWLYSLFIWLYCVVKTTYKKFSLIYNYLLYSLLSLTLITIDWEHLKVYVLVVNPRPLLPKKKRSLKRIVSLTFFL